MELPRWAQATRVRRPHPAAAALAAGPSRQSAHAPPPARENEVYVRRMDADNWTAGTQRDVVTEGPELEQIEAGLARMDGRLHT